MDDDIDSLFEGMDLITPSQLDGDGDGEEKHPQNLNNSTATNTNINVSESEAAAAAASSSSIHNNSQLEPLDDNLFSDLTLVSDLSVQSHHHDYHHPIITTSTTFPSQHNHHHHHQLVSRKKKRAASLRIGYARQPSSSRNLNLHHDDDDNNDNDNDNDLPSLPTPTTTTSIHHPNETILHHCDDASQSTSAAAITTTLANGHSPGLELDGTTISGSVSDSQQFEHIKSQISEKLQRSLQLAASVSNSRKDAIRKRRKAAEDLNSASAKHKDLELQLEAACDAEDFEAAQRISDSLASADKERLTLLSALKDAEALCNSVDSQMQHILNSQIIAEQECADLLSNFAKDAQTNADLILKHAHSFSSEELDQWFFSSEALEAKKIELDIESHFINEARLAVHDSIEHSIEDYRKEEQILHNRKAHLTDELQKLLTLVKLKEMEIAENDSNIKAIQDKISDVVSSFQEGQSSIDAKYDILQSQLSQLHLQTGALSAKRQEIDKFLADQEDHGAKLRELARVSEYEAKAYQEVVQLRKNLMLSILKSKENKVMLAKTEEELIKDVQMLQDEVSSARASLQELSSTKSNIQQTIASFKQRIFFIDKRVPELEAEKKVAATARNFKEAARIAAEAKSLSVEKDSVKIDLEKATSELEKLEEDIKNTVSRLQDTEQLISSKEKEVAMAKFQSLLLIAGAATAERVAALDLGDTEEASLLLAEAEAANAEAKELQLTCNFSAEEFSNLPKHFISMELVSKLGKKQLVELAASFDASASQ